VPRAGTRPPRVAILGRTGLRGSAAADTGDRWLMGRTELLSGTRSEVRVPMRPSVPDGIEGPRPHRDDKRAAQGPRRTAAAGATRETEGRGRGAAAWVGGAEGRLKQARLGHLPLSTADMLGQGYR
jgi:hypothetical protein